MPSRSGSSIINLLSGHGACPVSGGHGQITRARHRRRVLPGPFRVSAAVEGGPGTPLVPG